MEGSAKYDCPTLLHIYISSPVDYEFTSMICVPVKGRRNSTPGDNNLCTIGVAACFDKLGPSKSVKTLIITYSCYNT